MPRPLGVPTHIDAGPLETRPMQVNLPNALTLSRIVAVPVVCVLIVYDRVQLDWLALAIYIYACITDFFDGYLARRHHQQSRFGQMLDPIADKLLVVALLLVLVGVDRIRGFALLPALVIVCREMVVSGLREFLAQLSVSVPVSRLAKWKTTLQMLALGFLVIGGHGPHVGAMGMADLGIGGLWAAAVLTLVTGYDYLRASFSHLSGAPIGEAALAPLAAEQALDA